MTTLSLALLSMIEGTGPVDNDVLPLPFGVNANTAAVSTVTATVAARVRAAAEKRVRPVRLGQMALRESKARRDLFLLVNSIVLSTQISSLVTI